jgi:hypothetical protein
MTLSTHLRTILKALGTGGQIPEGRTAVEKIFTAIGERLNRFLLPTPTVTSEGKTMVVQDGVWRMGAIGSIFTVKGSVDTIENLPTTGNVVGDVYHISQNGAEYVWITSTVHPTGYWEQFGYAVDSELSQDSINPVRNSTIASAFNLYTEYLNEKVDANNASVFNHLLILEHEDTETGVNIFGHYNAGSPKLELFGSENDELVRLGNLASPTDRNDAATKLYVDTAIDNLDPEHIRAVPAPIVNNNSLSDFTVTPIKGHVYNCLNPALSSLTITNSPATGKYSIIFFSGSTPTTVVGIDNFTAEANKRYKITVEDNYATYDSWPYTPT